MDPKTLPLDPAQRGDDALVMQQLGRALAVLRERAGLSQAEAGRKANLTGQGWGKYETGSAPSIFRPSVQASLAGAVGSSLADFWAEVARVRAAFDRLGQLPADEDWQARNFLDAEDAV